MSGPNQGYPSGFYTGPSNSLPIQGHPNPAYTTIPVDPAAQERYRAQLQEMHVREMAEVRARQERQLLSLERNLLAGQPVAVQSQATAPPPAPQPQPQPQAQSTQVQLTAQQAREIQAQDLINQQLLAAYEYQRVYQHDAQFPQQTVAGPSRTAEPQRQQSYPAHSTSNHQQYATTSLGQTQTPGQPQWVYSPTTGWGAFQPSDANVPTYPSHPGYWYVPVTSTQATATVPVVAAPQPNGVPLRSSPTLSSLSRGRTNAPNSVNELSNPRAVPTPSAPIAHNPPQRTTGMRQSSVNVNGPSPSVTAAVPSGPARSATITQRPSNTPVIDKLLSRARDVGAFGAQPIAQPFATRPLPAQAGSQRAASTSSAPARQITARADPGPSNPQPTRTDNDHFMAQQRINIIHFDTVLAANPSIQKYIMGDPELKSIYDEYRRGPWRGEEFDPKHLYQNLLLPVIHRKQSALLAASNAVDQSDRPQSQPPSTSAQLNPARARPDPSTRAAPPPSQGHASASHTNAPLAPAPDGGSDSSTVALDVLKALGMLPAPGNKKRKRGAESTVSDTLGPILDSSAGAVGTSAPPISMEAAAGSRISPALATMADKALSVPIIPNAEPVTKDLPNPFVPPPGSLAAKVAALPSVPILQLTGRGRRSRTAAPEAFASQEPSLPPALSLAPAMMVTNDSDSHIKTTIAPASHGFPAPVIIQSATVPPSTFSVQFLPTIPEGELSMPDPAPMDVEPARPSKAHDVDVNIHNTGAHPPINEPTSALPPTQHVNDLPQAPHVVEPPRPPYAETLRNPDVVAKHYPRPKGLVVEVVIPISKKSAARAAAARRANTNLWPDVQDRLHRFQCKWSECDAILDSSTRLKAHVLKAHIKSSTDNLCQWAGCDTEHDRTEDLEEHVLKRHLNRYSFVCPFEGCSHISRSESRLEKHIRLDHPGDQDLRPLALPRPPKLMGALPPLPAGPVLPYEVLFLPVQQASITPEYHQELGPWVLRRIVGTVKRYQPRSDGALSLSPIKAHHGDDETSPASSPASSIVVETRSTAVVRNPESLEPAKYRYAFLDGDSRQIVIRHAPMHLDDIVREPVKQQSSGQKEGEHGGDVKGAQEQQQRDADEPGQEEAQSEDQTGTAQLPLFLPDDEDQGDDMPLFLPESPTQPLFLPDDDEDDAMQGPPRRRPGRPFYNRLQNMDRSSDHGFDSEEVEAHL